MKSKAAKQAVGAMRNSGLLRRRVLPVLIAGCFGTATVLANPSGHQVVNGQASFSQQGNVLTITNSPGAIINWQNFSINAGETTRFLQQSANSSVLNRVIGQDPSQILGALQSNGRVFLINPNGILFGAGATVDVNGLIASTLNISNEDFLAGRMKFAGDSHGKVENAGAITTPNGGQVYLIAPNVENSGVITAPNGDVMLAAGHTVHLVDSTNPALQVVLSAPEHEALNVGQIVAHGGQASVYGALVRQRGTVSANSAEVGTNGKIYFRASRDTMLESGSVTSATGTGGGSKGGEIQILGERVGLMGSASVDASGQAGGGTVLVGGDYRGANPAVQNASRTYVSADARIAADAYAGGDGGKVIVWGDETARVYGQISARGGAASGNGGLVETSAQHLDVAGISVDTRAARGTTGSWLLDPMDIVISETGSAQLGEVGAFEFNGDGTSVIAAGLINTATSHVILEAKNDITFGSAVNIVSEGVGIYADAGNSIAVNAPITTNGGIISLAADTWAWQPDGTGTIAVNAAINTNGGDLNLLGPAIMIGSNGVLNSGDGYVSIYADGNVSNGGTISSNYRVEISAPSGKISNTGAIAAGESVSLLASKMHLSGSIATTSTEGAVDIETYDSVELGSTDASDSGSYVLQLSDSELDTIQTQTLRIFGGYGIHVQSAISPANVGRALSLHTYEGITQDAGATIAAPALAMDARFVDLQEANETGVIAASVEQDFRYRTRNRLTISEVDGLDGISRYYWDETENGEGQGIAVPGVISLQSDSALGINQSGEGGIYADGATVVLRTPGSVMLNGAFNSIDDLAASVGGALDVYSYQDMRVSNASTGVEGITAGGNVRLGVGYGGLLSVDAQINAGSAEVELVADHIALNANVTAGEASLRPYTGGRSITVGGDECAISDCLHITNLHRISAHTIGIGRDPLDYDGYDGYDADSGSGYDYGYGYGYGYGNAGPIHVNGITNTGTGAASDRNSATQLIGLLTDEEVTQSGAINVSGLGVVAGGDVVLNHSGNTVSRVFGASLDGSFSFVNVGSLTIGAPDDFDPDYDTVGIWAESGNISVSNTGHLQVAAKATVLTDSGSIGLVAHSPLTIHGMVASASGDIALEAADSGSPADVLTVNGDVSTTGQIALKAGAGIVVNGRVHGANIWQEGQGEPDGPHEPGEPGGPGGSDGSGGRPPVTQETSNTVVSMTVQAMRSVTNLAGTEQPENRTNDDAQQQDDRTAAAGNEDGVEQNESGKKLYCN